MALEEIFLSFSNYKSMGAKEHQSVNRIYDLGSSIAEFIKLIAKCFFLLCLINSLKK